MHKPIETFWEKKNDSFFKIVPTKYRNYHIFYWTDEFFKETFEKITSFFYWMNELLKRTQFNWTIVHCAQEWITWKMNENFENERTHFVNDWKKVERAYPYLWPLLSPLQASFEMSLTPRKEISFSAPFQQPPKYNTIDIITLWVVKTTYYQ